jgi:hypothetical protein
MLVNIPYMEHMGLVKWYKKSRIEHFGKRGNKIFWK